MTKSTVRLREALHYDLVAVPRGSNFVLEKNRWGPHNAEVTAAELEMLKRTHPGAKVLIAQKVIR